MIHRSEMYFQQGSLPACPKHFPREKVLLSANPCISQKVPGGLSLAKDFVTKTSCFIRRNRHQDGPLLFHITPQQK